MTSAPTAVFAALGDANRQRLLELLGARGEATASQLASPLGVSRQAVSKHLDVLAGAGLVTGRRSGREVRFSVEQARLAASATWLADAAERWDRRLRAVKAAAERGRED